MHPGCVFHASMGQTGLLPGPRAAPIVPVYSSLFLRCARRLPVVTAVCKWTGPVLSGQQESHLLLIRHTALQRERPVHPLAQPYLAPGIDCSTPQGCRLRDIREAARTIFCLQGRFLKLHQTAFLRGCAGWFWGYADLCCSPGGKKISLAGLGFVEYKWPLINF